MVGRQDRSARSQPECADKLWRVRDLHFQFFARRECAGLQFVNVGWGVDQKDVLIRRGLRCQEVAGRSRARVNQFFVDTLILLCGKNVHPDWEVVVVAVNEFKRKHRRTGRLSGVSPWPSALEFHPAENFLSYAGEAAKS